MREAPRDAVNCVGYVYSRLGLPMDKGRTGYVTNPTPTALAQSLDFATESDADAVFFTSDANGGRVKHAALVHRERGRISHLSHIPRYMSDGGQPEITTLEEVIDEHGENVRGLERLGRRANLVFMKRKR